MDVLALPNVVIDAIGRELEPKDLFRFSFTCRDLKDFFNKEFYWQELMEKAIWFERRFFRFQDDAQYLLNNTPDRHFYTEQFDQKVVRYAIYSHDGTMLAAYGNGCRLWVFRGDEEILHVYLSRKRGWDRVISLEFSPNDEHILVTGRKEELVALSRGNEALIYKLNDDHATLRSYISLDSRMFSIWFDNKHVLYTQNQTIRGRMRLCLSSLDMAAEILMFPILTFDFRINNITIAQHVSPRTRKITQIADQAQEEGKTLNQKLIEIGMESGVDVTNMNELRAILDQETQCMPCYRLHSHHDAISSRDCQCQCHNNTDKLLIFHGNTEQVHVKVITERILEKAREAFRERGEVENEEQDRLFAPLFLCTQFDTVDHAFRTNLDLSNAAMCFSPDHRYLYITGTRKAPKPRDSSLLIKPTCLDLETMVVKNMPDFTFHNWVDHGYTPRVTANNDFVAIFTGQNVIIWSAFHRGSPVAILNHPTSAVSSVAFHPLKNFLAVTNELLVHYYHSPIMAREEKTLVAEL
ncbi:unnamed protein product [Caenorhabditis brenneri]